MYLVFRDIELVKYIGEILNKEESLDFGVSFLINQNKFFRDCEVKGDRMCLRDKYYQVWELMEDISQLKLIF